MNRTNINGVHGATATLGTVVSCFWVWMRFCDEVAHEGEVFTIYFHSLWICTLLSFAFLNVGLSYYLTVVGFSE